MNKKTKELIGLILNSVMLVYVLTVCILGCFISLHWSLYLSMALVFLSAMVYNGIVLGPEYNKSILNTGTKEDNLVNKKEKDKK